MEKHDSYQSETLLSFIPVKSVGARRAWQKTDNHVEANQAVSEGKKVIFAFSMEDAHKQLNENANISPPFVKFNITGWNNRIDELGELHINNQAPTELILEVLKENKDASFPTTGEFKEEWRDVGITKNRDDEIRYDPKAAKAAKRASNIDRDALRRKKGDYDSYFIKNFAFGIVRALEESLGRQIRMRLYSYRDREDVETSIVKTIKHLKSNDLVKHLLRNSCWKGSIRNRISYVDPPTYRAYQKESANRIVLDFIRMEAIHFGFIKPVTGDFLERNSNE